MCVCQCVDYQEGSAATSSPEPQIAIAHTNAMENPHEATIFLKEKKRKFIVLPQLSFLSDFPEA
jgi:hypothetical protein